LFLLLDEANLGFSFLKKNDDSGGFPKGEVKIMK